MKMFVLERWFYGDFDIHISEPIAVSANKETLVIKRNELMAKRSEKEIENDVTFEINPDQVQVL